MMMTSPAALTGLWSVILSDDTVPWSRTVPTRIQLKMLPTEGWKDLNSHPALTPHQEN